MRGFGLRFWEMEDGVELGVGFLLAEDGVMVGALGLGFARSDGT